METRNSASTDWFIFTQAIFRAVQLRNDYDLQKLSIARTALELTVGAVVHLLIADNIELHGLGDGVSFLICLSIVSGAHRPRCACRVLQQTPFCLPDALLLYC